MSSVSGYLEKHPQEAQRLVGVNYDQLKQLVNQTIALHTKAKSETELRKVRIIKKGVVAKQNYLLKNKFY